MLRSVLGPGVVAAVFGLAAVMGAANAQEAEDGYGEPMPDAELEMMEPVEPPPAPATRVYGWTAPESCGVFKYWDGARCVDARDDPPDIGPRP